MANQNFLKMIIDKIFSLRRFFTNKRIIILTIVLIILFFIIQSFSGGNKSASSQKVIELKRGNIFSSVSSTGEVEAKENQLIGFIPTGVVKEIKVKEGDSVKKGDYIASLDLVPLEAQLNVARGSQYSASSSFNKAKDSNSIEIQKQSLESTKLDLENAKSNLEKTKAANKNDIKKAEIALEASRSSLSRQSDDLDLVDDQIDETNYPSEAEEISGDREKNSVEGKLEQSEYQNQQTMVELDSVKIGTKKIEDTASTEISKLEKKVASDELLLKQYEANQKFDGGVYGGQLTSASGNVKAAEYNLSKAKIYAPFDGTVIKIPFKEGEQYLGTQATGSVQVANLENCIINSDFNELDIVSMKVGQKVIIDFDALPDKKFEGVIDKIYPGPIEKDKVINYRVDISFKKPDNIYLGMTANVEVITEEHQNIISVPIGAVEVRDNESYVKLMDKKNNKVDERKIKTGLQNDSDIEVIEGLNEGETILY